jgi:glycosyltransferase involved in cell wall biosynthesis
MKISVCIIARNEERNLAKALMSVPAGYEIIVTDTGSSDRTVEVAMSLGARVEHYQWNDDFSAARNYCASFATGEYILALDADEELPPDTEEQIRLFVARHPGKAGCVTIVNEAKDEATRHRMVRFYPNLPRFSFHRSIHEQVYENGSPASFESLHLQIRHYGYEQELYRQKDKFSRYLPLYVKYLASHPDDGYMLYQIGKLHYGMEQYAEAERYLRLGVGLREHDRLYFPVMLVLLGYCLKEQNRYDEAERLLEPYQPVYPDYPDLYFLLGLLAMDSGKMARIEACFTEALKIGETEKYTSAAGVGSFKAAYNLGVYYEITGNAELAEQCYRFAAECGYSPALGRLK